MFFKDKIRLCFVGNPNVGKSTLINRILGINKLKTDSNPGTTKKIIETTLNWKNKEFTFIDTAGVFKKKNIDFNVLVKTMKTCDIVIVILEATIEKLDRLYKRLINHSLTNGKGLIIIFNKWDLIINKRKVKRRLIHFLKFASNQIDESKIFFISALRDIKFNKILNFSFNISKNLNKKISTVKLNKWLHKIIKLNSPSKIKGKDVKFKYITQIKQQPPIFSVFVNRPKKINLTYKRFLEKELRLNFNFKNVPVFIKFSSTKNPYLKK